MTRIFQPSCTATSRLSVRPRLSCPIDQSKITILNSEKTCALSELLPYSVYIKQHAKLENGIKEYTLLIEVAVQAIDAWISSQLSMFDSLVGENACQIRATILTILHTWNNIDATSLISQLSKVKRKIDCLKHAHQDLLQQPGKLSEYGEWEIRLSVSERFLIASFLLTSVRIIFPPDPTRPIIRNEKTKTERIKKFGKVGSTFARELVKTARKLVSEDSVSFIQDLACLSSLPQSELCMVSDKYRLVHDKFGRLSCIPAFWTASILIEQSTALNIPMIFILSQIARDISFHAIYQEVLVFKPSLTSKYIEVDLDTLEPTQSAIIIYGSCSQAYNDLPNPITWRESLVTLGPENLILAYAAAHRQYPDEQLDDVLTSTSNCESYIFYKKKAYEWGCSVKDPSLFFLVHALADTVGNVRATLDKSMFKCFPPETQRKTILE